MPLPPYTGPTLSGKADPQVLRTIADLTDRINALASEIQSLQAQVASLPPPLTLQQISQGLSATGEAPLNVNGLSGTLAPAPS